MYLISFRVPLVWNCGLCPMIFSSTISSSQTQRALPTVEPMTVGCWNTNRNWSAHHPDVALSTPFWRQPWLWAVFAIVVVLPLLMLVVYCCMSASKVCRCSITTEGVSFLSSRCMSIAACQRPRSVVILSLPRVYLSCLVDVCLLLHVSVQGLSLFYHYRGSIFLV